MLVSEAGFQLAFVPSELGGSDNATDQALLQSGDVNSGTNSKDTKGGLSLFGLINVRTIFKDTKSASDIDSSISTEDGKAGLGVNSRPKSDDAKDFSKDGSNADAEVTKTASKDHGNTVDDDDVDGWVQVAPKKEDILEETVSTGSDPIRTTTLADACLQDGM